MARGFTTAVVVRTAEYGGAFATNYFAGESGRVYVKKHLPTQRWHVLAGDRVLATAARWYRAMLWALEEAAKCA